MLGHIIRHDKLMNIIIDGKVEGRRGRGGQGIVTLGRSKDVGRGEGTRWKS